MPSRSPISAATTTVFRRLRAVVLVATANVSCLPFMTAWVTASCCLAVVSWSTIWARWIEAISRSVDESPLDARSIAASDRV